MKIKLSKSDWELIGQKTGWLKLKTDQEDGDNERLLTWQDEAAAMSRRQCGYCESHNCDGTCVYEEVLENMIYKVLNMNTFDTNANGGRTIETVLVDDLKSLKRMEAKRPELRETRQKAVEKLSLEQQEFLFNVEGMV